MSFIGVGIATSGAPGLIQLGGDLGNTGLAPYVASVQGASPIAVTPAAIQWAAATAAPTLSQVAAVSGAGANITIAPQAATTTGASGSLILNVSAFASGTAEAGFILERAGTKLATFQPWVGGPTAGAVIYAGGITPSATNYGLLLATDGTSAFLQGSSSSSLVVNGTAILGCSSSIVTIQSGVTLTTPTLKASVIAGGAISMQFSNSAVTLTSNAATLSGAQQLTPNLTLAAVTLTGAAVLDFGNVTGNFQVNILGVNAASFATFGLSFKNGTTTTALPSTAITNGGLVVVRCDTNAIAFVA